MSNVVTGARALFRMTTPDGVTKKIAYAFGVDVDVDIEHQEVQTLDALSVEEHVPTAYRVGLSAEVFKTVKSSQNALNNTQPGAEGVSSLPGSYGSLEEMNLYPKVGQSDMVPFLTRPMTAKLYDSVAGRQVGLVLGVRAGRKSFAYRARQITSENVTFVAKRFLSESETA